ncbi:MAG: anthranilate synthase component II [Bacteroidota bacterium]
MKILLLDNYDSFTYNLFHYLNNFESDVTVIRNDEISVEETGQFDRIVFSPGPGLPEEAGRMIEIIRRYSSEKKMLGICLGMQAIAQAFGGKLINLSKVHHGVAIATEIVVSNEPLFSGLPHSFKTGRYHSWCVDPGSLPSSLIVTALDIHGEIMALTHENQLVKGVQFHPESILTEWGKDMIYNWLYKC